MKSQQQICADLAEVANAMNPRDFQSFFGGVLGNTVGNMSDRYWKKFREVKPCGRVGCDCHLTIVPTVMKALEALREDHQREMSNTFSE